VIYLNKILYIFKKKFKQILDIGTEFFEGNRIEMIMIIDYLKNKEYEKYLGYKFILYDSKIIIENNLKEVHSKTNEIEINNNKCGKEVSNKYYLKKCKIKNLKEITEVIESPDITLINSNVEEIPKIAINILNTDLIYYDKQENKINFDISHFNEEIIDIIIRQKDFDAFNYLSDILFQNKKNQFIIKK